MSAYRSPSGHDHVSYIPVGHSGPGSDLHHSTDDVFTPRSGDQEGTGSVSSYSSVTGDEDQGVYDARNSQTGYGSIGARGSPYASPYNMPNQYPSLLEPSEDDKLNEKRRNTCLIGWGFLLFCIGVITLALTLTVFPNLIRRHANNQIADFYCPDRGSSAWEAFLHNDLPNQAPNYDIFYLYNVTNAMEVMYSEAQPQVSTLGPFIYIRHERKDVATWQPGSLEYKTWTWHERVLDPVSFQESDGSVTTLTPVNPDVTWLRMPNPVVLGVINTLVLNPLEHQAITNFTNPCLLKHRCQIGGSIAQQACARDALWKCLDDMLQGVGSSLNKTVDLYPLRTATEWLGVTLNNNDLPADKMWKAVSTYVEKIDIQTYWAFFANTSQQQQPNYEDIRGTTVAWDRDNVDQGRPYKQWNGHALLVNAFSTARSLLFNVLNYRKFFIGWGSDLQIDHTGFIDGTLTHPKLDIDVDPHFNILDDRCARPWIMTYQYGVEFNDVKGDRYLFAYENMDGMNFNTKVFFSNEVGLANVTSLFHFSDMHVSTPRYYLYDEAMQSRILPSVPKPDPIRDSSFMDVEPESGVVMNWAYRFQYNTWMPSLNFSETSVLYRMQNGDSPSFRTLIPTVIHENRFQLNDDLASTLRDLQNVKHIQNLLYLWGSVGGGLFSLVGVFFFVAGTRRRLKSASDSKVGSQGRPWYGGGPSSALIYDSSR